MYCELKEGWRGLCIMREGCVHIYVFYVCMHTYTYVHTHFIINKSVGNSRGLTNYPFFFFLVGKETDEIL